MREDKSSIRELSSSELKMVSGGLNLQGILGAITLGWQIGFGTGQAINNYNASYGRNLGASIYELTH